MQNKQVIQKDIAQQESWTLKDFINFVEQRIPQAIETKYYIEINLISDYFLLLSMFSLNALSKNRKFQYHTAKRSVDDEFHIIEIFVKKDENEAKMKILLIQMDKIVKITFESWISSEKKFKKTNQFSFDHCLYLRNKVSNSYKLHNLKEISQNFKEGKIQSQLNYLYLSRALQSLAISFKSLNHQAQVLNELDFIRFFNTSKNYTLSRLFFQIISNPENLIKISSFLNIGSIQKLSRTTKIIKNYFFTPSNVFYKKLYEFSFGRTGFDINQMDWVKSLSKKRSQKAKTKQKSSQWESSLIFRTH